MSVLVLCLYELHCISIVARVLACTCNPWSLVMLHISNKREYNLLSLLCCFQPPLAVLPGRLTLSSNAPSLCWKERCDGYYRYHYSVLLTNSCVTLCW